MSQMLATASTLVLALMAHGPSHAANLFQDLDAPSLEVARDAVQAALETRMRGDAEFWNVPGVARGAVIPRRTWKSASGHWCREFDENLQLVDGRTQTTRAVRCPASDGRWRLIGG